MYIYIAFDIEIWLNITRLYRELDNLPQGTKAAAQTKHTIIQKKA